MKTEIKMTGWAAAIAMTMMSCAAAVHVETDQSASLAGAKTYEWVETKTNQSDTRNVSAFGDQAIHTAVQQALAKKGWREVTDHPDLLITHDVLVKRTRQQQSDPLYTQPFTRVYYNPYFRRWGTVYYPSQFLGYDTYTVPVREGTLTITILDANSDKTVWQGWTTEELDNQRLSSQEVQKAAEQILKKLR